MRMRSYGVKNAAKENKSGRGACPRCFRRAGQAPLPDLFYSYLLLSIGYLPVASPTAVVVEVTVAMTASPSDRVKIPITVPATSKIIFGP